MKSINLKKLIAVHDLDTEVVAQQLFPANKYPRQALNRVLSGKAVLDANQISKLASLVGVPIEALFTGAGWKSTVVKPGDEFLKFIKGDYTIELNTSTWVTKIFHNKSLFHESMVCPSSTPLDEYFERVEELIIKQHESKN